MALIPQGLKPAFLADPGGTTKSRVLPKTLSTPKQSTRTIARQFPKFLLDGDRRLSTIDRDGLQAGIARSAASDRQGRLSIGLGLESQRDDRALA